MRTDSVRDLEQRLMDIAHQGLPGLTRRGEVMRFLLPLLVLIAVRPVLAQEKPSNVSIEGVKISFDGSMSVSKQVGETIDMMQTKLGPEVARYHEGLKHLIFSRCIMWISFLTILIGLIVMMTFGRKFRKFSDFNGDDWVEFLAPMAFCGCLLGTILVGIVPILSSLDAYTTSCIIWNISHIVH